MSQRARSIAVIGGGIGGLTAAATLAKQGHAVTLFEATDSLGGKAQSVSANGLTLDTGPTLLTMPSVVQETFAQLGAEALMPRIHRLELQSQYRSHDGADFFCWQDLERAASSAEDLLHGEGERFKRFSADAQAIYEAAGAPFLEAPYESMPGFLARVLQRGPAKILTGLKLSTLQSLALKHFRAPMLQKFVGRFATYAGASPFECSAAFAMIAHIERAFGVHHVEGGMIALVNALVKVAKQNGVTVRLNSSVQWKRLQQGFEVGQGTESNQFDSLVVNADPLASLDRSNEPLAMSGFVMLLEANARLSLPHHTIVFADDYKREFAEIFAGQNPTDPTVYVCHPAATDSTVAPEGKSGLFVMVNVPAFSSADTIETSQRHWEAAAGPLAELTLKKLRAQFPELKGATLKQLGQRTPVDLARKGAPGGSIYGFLPHGKFGPFRRPMMRSDTPGLFFAGGGTHPGGGVPMVMLSGRFAADMARAWVEQRS